MGQSGIHGQYMALNLMYPECRNKQRQALALDLDRLDLYSWQVTMFFSDIASFTTIVESMPPQKSLLLLSRYFQVRSDLVD